MGGLHRSGTTLVADLLAAAPGIGAITGAPVPEQEGVYLQGAIPHGARHGIPGAFAFDPDQHLTETSRFNTHEVARRIAAEWDSWYPASPRLRVEKSPVNLLRSRLYQSLFPTALFVFVIRHPIAVARATAKWSGRAERELIAHWEQAHDLLFGDLPHLHNHVLLRYEDLARDPASQLRRLSAFTGVEIPLPSTPIDNRNAQYAQPPCDAVFPVARILGYGPDPMHLHPIQIATGNHYFRSVTEQL
ncbi:sulfotransferase [Sphingomonas sp.]|uniref:sulfotransferase family protein n=1 Tax=Sphingomonas sp. TaxID=28214 RepID=UPI002BD7B3EF|nr:sulfotransferase [Sphingomonas sp.]HTG37504.1 sulfotransferase [Sphingomonas sp.]